MLHSTFKKTSFPYCQKHPLALAVCYIRSTTAAPVIPHLLASNR